ncbi:MAG TPA: nitrilase-related carbon-nitrogen hydrolase [bacterium]|nr:nitrilase-related carbon-nitrogen hydrolase [bacterium]HOL66293.1 nitrilase-related carbon-nitrogen hydrolase [bacterium]HPP12406.1 nitrilase-related carbon-nitrogen hydrolase [bacterium]
MLKIGLVQFRLVPGDRAENKRRIQELVRAFSDRPDWLIFPEMTLTGFFLRQDQPEPAAEDEAFFGRLARERNCWVTFGTTEERQNVAITLDRQATRVATYRKIHLFSLSGEERHHLPGKQPVSFSLRGMKVTPAICYDLRFPLLFYQQARTTDLFVILAHWPLSRIDHWEILLKARAVENLSYVIGVNHTGDSPDGKGGGHSLVVTPEGQVLLDAGQAEGIFTAVVAKEVVAQTRKRWPFLKDRKPLEGENDSTQN